MTGKHSKKLARLALREDYEKLLGDERQAHVRDEIALIDSRILQLIDRMPEGISGSFLQDAWKTYRRMLAGGPNGAVAMRELGEMLRSGASESECWMEVVTLVDQRRKLARVQQQHDEKMERYFALQTVIGYFAQMAQAVAMRVQDPHVRHLIADDFDRITYPVIDPDKSEQKALPGDAILTS